MYAQFEGKSIKYIGDDRPAGCILGLFLLLCAYLCFN